MLGERGPQRGLFEADTMYLDFVGRNTFYGFLAAHRGEIFRDEDFAGLYNLKMGRPSVPPSLLATALVLQTYDQVSDDEARRRASYDLQWKVALGIPVDQQPFAKSTLWEFRAQLVLQEEQGAIFRRSLELAKQKGFFKGKRKLKLALDTTNILGRGAVKDTYNLLADGIRLVLRVLAEQDSEDLEVSAEREGFGRYVVGPSLKGQAEIDWDDGKARRQFLSAVVADADRLLARVREARSTLAENSPEDQALTEAAGPLSRVLQQDIERKADGPELRDGVAKDRLPSVHDPEMRHGRKSKTKRFDGHKGQVAVDTETQLITAVAVLPGNAHDHEQALAAVEQTEDLTGYSVEETIGDCAYGDGPTRQAFADAKRKLVAKVAPVTNQGYFPKTRFQIDLDGRSCTCPAHQVSRDLRPKAKGGGVFRFATGVCGPCPLRSQCLRGSGGRTVQVHPQEALLQAARAFQASPAFAPNRVLRQTVEHRLARLVQLGIRQARYVGRSKVLFQLAMAAAVANLTLVANAAIQPLAALQLPRLGLLSALVGLPMGSRTAFSNSARRLAQAPPELHVLPRMAFPITPCRPGF
ncbi:MAG: IS1182 family transposase [Chloroflexi bacterium]|nr:IS1182 family transposase [Chloroflexota bacterium]